MIPFLPDWVEEQHGLTPLAASAIIGVLAAGAVGSAWLMGRRRVFHSFVALTIGMASFLLIIDNLVAPDLDPYKTALEPGRVMKELQPHSPVAVYTSVVGMFDSALFYHDLSAYDVNIRDVAEHLDRAEPTLIVLERSRLERLEREKLTYHVVWENEGRLIISNRSAESWGNPR